MPTVQFKGKNVIWNHHLGIPYHALDEIKSLRFQSKKSGGNLIIEGDNLIALKSLLPQYSGRVRCIYIDPPYNTGKEEWVYSDRVNSPLISEWLGQVVGKDDLSKHDKWCCMMAPRLRLLRELLTDDGVIIISCDNNERHHLKTIMNEIFVADNYVGNIVWKNATDNNPTNVATEHEYLEVYALNKKKLPPVWRSRANDAKTELIRIGEKLNKKYGDSDELQAAYTDWFRENKKFLGTLDRYKYIDREGVFTGSQSVHNPGKEGYRYDVIHPVTKKPCLQPLMGYRFPETTMQELLDAGKVLFGEDEDKIVELKVYAHEYEDKLSSVYELDGRLGAYDLRELFGDVPFRNPKPVQLLTHFLSFITRKDDIVLDSFAGSGTTMHAVMELNKADGGNRQCVMVQMKEDGPDEPEKNICKNITRERVKLAIKKYGYESGFRYLRVGIPIDPESLLEGNLPTYKQLAEYVYYLCTGGILDATDNIDQSDWFVGTDGTRSVYLIYENDFDKLTRHALNLVIAEKIVKHGPKKRRIVYAPACFLDEEYMEAQQLEFVSLPYGLFQRNVI